MVLAPLTACANSSGGKTLEQLLAPDPQLLSSPTPQPSPEVSIAPTPAAISLPNDFPAAIPIYPESTLEVVAPLSGTAEGAIARWLSPDSPTLIQRYYQTELTERNWQITSPKDAPQQQLSARLDTLELTLTFAPPTSGQTTYTLTYRFQEGEPTPEPSVSPSPNPTPSPSPVTTDFPAATQAAVEQVIALGITGDRVTWETFQPHEPITRREYARWLMKANNILYQDNPGKQIRLASAATNSVFSDVSKSDTDFPYIQGLAEAGLVPSALTGQATETLFRPDAPLTREYLIAWKVPLDTRAALPKGTPEAIKETWGFQDAGKINPQVLPSILADFQNGNQANIRRVFGYTQLFQPQKTVTRGEAAATLAYFGTVGEGRSAQEAQSLRP